MTIEQTNEISEKEKRAGQSEALKMALYHKQCTVHTPTARIRPFDIF